MIRWMVKTTAAAAALGASAMAANIIFLGQKRLRDWETLRCEDAGEGDFVTLSGGERIHYVQRGSGWSPVDPLEESAPDEGRDVILLHGLMSSTYEWAKNIDALAARHRVWAIDLIGFGFSSRVAEPAYSLKYHARSIREFLDAQGIARASIVGHSLGGGIALQFAHDFPERADKLILIDPAAYIYTWFKALQLAARVPGLPRTVGSIMLCNPRVHRSALRNALGDPARLDERALDARMRASRVKGTLDALLAMGASPHASEMPEGLNETAAPTLIIWGDQDLVLPLRHAERLARDLPNAELVILEGAGHIPNEEFPDVVNRLMLDFLRKV